MAVNLDRLALKDLLDLQSSVEAAIVAARERERAEVKAKVEAMVQAAGFSLSELFASRPSRKSSGARFVNPGNRSQTWTGRGRKPNWLLELVANGVKLEDLAIR
jgi:DNA-binding protein H-NS